MSADEVVTKTLVLQVFDWDLITGDDDIGEVSIQYLDLLLSHNDSTIAINSVKKKFFLVQIRIPLANIDLQNGTDQWIEIEKLTNVEGQQKS